MADAIVVPGGEVPGDLNLLRAINPKHLDGKGQLCDNSFFLSRSKPKDGVSTGIEPLITVQQLRNLQCIRKRCGEACGVAVMNVGEVLNPVQDTPIRVLQEDDEEWGCFSHAHALITGHQGLPKGDEGKKKLKDFQRHLVNLARKRYFPAGSTVEQSTA